MLKPVERARSLRERAEIAIRGGIITGEIPPGEIFSAPALAKQLGVSATPIREAMLDLVREGMVEPIPNRGFRIVPLSDDDLDEITELRVMLEVPPLVALASRPDVLDATTVSGLRGLANAVDAYAATRDIAHFIDADRRFHLALIELHGNRRLLSQVERLRNATLRYGLRTVPSEVLAATAREHHLILDGLEAGTPEAVGRLVEQHLRSNRGVLAGRAPAG
jgi:DNA-binding GntR family transcriptional regulator